MGGGGGVCYKSSDVFVQPAFFLAGRNKWRNEWRGQVVAFKNLFVFKYFKHKDL